MIAGFLIRNLIGVTLAVGAVGAIVVYRQLTKRQIVDETLNKMKDESYEKTMEIVALRIKEKSEQAISLDALDKEFNSMADFKIDGSSDEVEVGDLIYINC